MSINIVLTRITHGERKMMTLYMIFGMFVGFEGYDNGKVYFGIYTPQYEYGYVITQNEIYLDTILEKSQD
jgi:hypothetical protein